MFDIFHILRIFKKSKKIKNSKTMVNQILILQFFFSAPEAFKNAQNGWVQFCGATSQPASQPASQASQPSQPASPSASQAWVLVMKLYDRKRVAHWRTERPGTVTQWYHAGRNTGKMWILFDDGALNQGICWSVMCTCQLHAGTGTSETRS